MSHRITLNNHGLKLGISGAVPGSSAKPRSSTQGWSSGSTRRNVDFLRSVDYSKLPAFALSFTGTVKDCPALASDWADLRAAFFKRVARMGVRCLHWVTEWQRRAVPHLHGIFYFDSPDPSLPVRLVSAWLAVARQYGADEAGQHVSPIYDALGWVQYTAKHAARGVSHYQRHPDNIPPGWLHSTGRVWGYRGKWPRRDDLKFSVSPEVFYVFRRLCQRWRLADARFSGSTYRIVTARRALQASCREISSVRGVSEWIPLDVSIDMLHYAVSVVGSSSDVYQI